ncbi:MAG: GNAT family N-acetyltransferase [Synergistaceae bacterium]|nr:GNAT family N-acetyltransferase [Synergistaceae bacterium]MBQ6738256.1 GNAT family N-acetyltransferase [Synergistaceae bacterium]MBQ7068874.1 GNAT family N-acetyltransferase [Synergistaceae bacterium]MBR0074494.1 GNAT family N-acetyltransferase [Synergistaceae bacterium]MBR0080652.1 GNAT family N-acetyltransferase [Synergistaceae bacterium]
MYLPEIDFLNLNNLPEILRINANSGCSWSEDIIREDLKKNSQNEITYIGAFATSTEASLLGYAVLGREKRFGLLMALAVDKNFRRIGIGTQLLMAVSDCATYLNMKRLKLKVRKSNSGAIALYKHFSFMNENIRQGYYSNGEDAIIMGAALPLKVI